MNTLIRASQLHPDVSGLVTNYTSPLYPNYNNIYATSGLVSIESGDSLVLTLANGNKGVVNNISNVTGVINITGVSGIGTYFNNSTLYIFPSGIGTVGTLNQLSGNINLRGSGTVQVWPLNTNTIIISGYSITGGDGINTFISGDILRIKGDSVTRLNSKSGQINLIGRNGITITPTGQDIYIDAGSAAFSGVNSLNGMKGSPLFLLPGKDIGITNLTGQNVIVLNYIGSGWGSNNSITGSSDPQASFIGNSNYINGGIDTFINGYGNFSTNNKNSTLIRSSENVFENNQNLCLINTSGSFINNVHASTIVNGQFNAASTFPHPYAFAVGTSSDNTFYNSLHMKALISGGFGIVNFNPIKKMKVPKTSYNGIFVQTGSVLIGHIDYVATKYNIQNFYASYDVASDGIYGRKHFVIQRGTNLKIDVKDQADLFGGSDKYNIILSGANDSNLYILASGYSGHDAIFMANLYYTQFNLTLIDE